MCQLKASPHEACSPFLSSWLNDNAGACLSMGLLKRWLPCPADLDHARTCTLHESACHVCLFMRLKIRGRWPWLDREKSGIGCRVCSQAGLQNRWATLSVTDVSHLRPYRLILHENSNQHRACTTDSVVHGHVAPPRSTFKAVLDAIKSSVFSAKGIGARCGSRP